MSHYDTDIYCTRCGHYAYSIPIGGIDKLEASFRGLCFECEKIKRKEHFEDWETNKPERW